jgi:hypothetical protein
LPAKTTVANTLAFYDTAIITAIKPLVQAPMSTNVLCLSFALRELKKRVDQENDFKGKSYKARPGAYLRVEHLKGASLM